MNRLPPDAFETYVALGPDRSYRAVAERFGVSKVTVVNRAKKEKWQERLAEMEEKVRQESRLRAEESLKAVHERQLKAARFLQAKAIEALQSQPPEKAIRAAGALNVAWKHELLLLGEPTERQASVEEITKREMARWLIADDGEDADDGSRNGKAAGPAE